MKLTFPLIIFNILIFLFSLTNPEYYIYNYGFSRNNFISGKYWTLLTSIFLHAGFSHLFFNMLVLFLIGSSLEKEVKWGKYIFVYFSSGILGNLAMMIPLFYSPETVGVGASGAISGLIGLGTFICPGKFVLFQSIIPMPFIVVVALYFVTTSSKLFLKSNIAYPVHFIGFLIGSVFSLISANKKERKKNVILFILVLMFILLIPYILMLIV